MDNLPPAIIGYLEEATISIAQHQNFSPTSEEELSSWLDSNFCKVVLKAKELQFNCWVKLVSNKKTHDLVSATIKKRVCNYYNQPQELTNAIWDSHGINTSI